MAVNRTHSAISQGRDKPDTFRHIVGARLIAPQQYGNLSDNQVPNIFADLYLALYFMAHYSFVTHWLFDAPLEKVWSEIRDMDAWPEWWSYVKSVEVISTGDEDDIGSVRRIVWRTALLYHLRFDSELVAIDFQKRIEGRAFGDLTGKGIWTFTHQEGITTVRYDWTVDTTKWWMNFLEPIARPLFRWNHDMVMKGGYKGLTQRLASDRR